MNVAFGPSAIACTMTPAEHPKVQTKLRGLALLRTFLVTAKLHEHKAAG
jgi:hypothetical protein